MKSRTQSLIIALLVLLNLVCLGYLLLSPSGPQHPPPGPPKVLAFLGQELSLTPVQQQKVEALREAHFKQNRSIHDRLKEQRDALFKQWQSQDMVQATADSIGKLHTEMELQTHRHFKEIRELCTPDQQVKFDEVIQRAMRRPPPHRRRRP